MITHKNYYEKIKYVDFSKLNKDFLEGKELVDDVTNKGTDWSIYESENTIKEAIDLYFETLSNELKTFEKKKEKNTKPKVRKPKSNPRITTPKKGDVVPVKKEVKSKTDSKADQNVLKVESISLELKFIRRFVNLYDKLKIRNQIRLFINALQKAIRERKITKGSKYAKEIIDIQDRLIKFHSSYKNDSQKKVIDIPEKTRSHLLSLLGRQTEMPSVKFIKSYINLQGKLIPNQKAKNLHNRIANALNKNKISTRDKYKPEIDKILSNLKTFVNKNPTEGILTIESRALNGLQGIVSGCGSCKKIQTELGRVPDNVVVNSLDVLNMKFDKLGLKGKWLNFIGNPSKHFNVMIFGRPKYGKSILAVDFAGYLARNHGKVLYVAKEEGIDVELQEKLMSVAHPNLDVVATFPEILDEWDFIFLDSVNKLRLSPQEMEDIREHYPNKSFISIFQTRKDGLFRGSQEFLHDMDVSIEVYEKGKARQNGRYNQGGELEFFNNNAA